jgi:hypothetical protein
MKILITGKIEKYYFNFQQRVIIILKELINIFKISIIISNEINITTHK